ncbi:sensor domain-containing diguanylate cyclase [Sphingomonas baiyangensis]|uniref:diguanylate cyclase n=1 Tax=Sphingomonas baiyangensis TaxID=2572576 RepID=A0A4U1L9E8_9SPHN|nr:diguanylate cyclase [Sphingomonas baiyangensis]TKD53045.1 diguanylate cyclase [Sphingomonas baiyangensis]
MPSFPRSILPSRRLWITGIGYVAATIGPVLFTRYGGGVACMWIATAVLAPFLVDMPRRHWPGVLLAAGIASAAVTAMLGLGPAAALPLAALNVAEAAMLAWILQRERRPDESTLASIDQVAVLLLGGLGVCTITGVAGAAVASAVTGTDYGPNLVNWIAGHALGIIIFAPVVMLALRGDVRDWLHHSTRGERIEAAFIVTVVGITAFGCFSQHALPLLFLPVLPVMMATFRAGRIGAAVSIVLLAGMAMTLTLRGEGPIALVDASPAFKVQFLQFYLATVVLAVLPAAADLRRRGEVLDRLAVSEARYRLLADNATDVIMSIDPAGTITYLSPSVEKFGGSYTPAELVGTQSIELIHPDHKRAVRRACIDALERPGETHIIEYRGLPRIDGGIWLESRIRATKGSQGELVCAIIDISARKAAEAELKRAAMTDPLTGLANRRAFNDALDRLCAAAARNGAEAGALAIFDIDHFKAINDRFGHDAGDRVLEAFARIAREVTRATDLVARLGGEEFGLLLPGAGTAHADEVCERLRRAFANNLTPANAGIIQATVSAGLARIEPGVAREPMMRAVDAALYRAKHLGRDRLELAA